jgi:hypothetical protein
VFENGIQRGLRRETLNKENNMLTEIQNKRLESLTRQITAAKSKFHSGENIINELNELGVSAHSLYLDLINDGNPIQFSENMRENRLLTDNATPGDLRFFQNLHALEDFISLASEA